MRGLLDLIQFLFNSNYAHPSILAWAIYKPKYIRRGNNKEQVTKVKQELIRYGILRSSTQLSLILAADMRESIVGGAASI